MEVLYRNSDISSPEVSIILLDWSCRESFHSLYYLKNQTVERRQYEIIWIEYYNRRSPEIEVELKEAQGAGRAPILDQWIVMGMPRNVYFHKHLMYNIGIVAGRGKIITLCDSDALFTTKFVESIIKSFGEDRNIVLHMDEFRNNDSRFYPFNYPSVEEVVGHGCINWRDGKTTGLLDNVDPLHSRNYGACMAALQEDLINIGGADEHIDYLGHICGPYEMTFRLVNAGKREVWHEEEFLYHVWHPGQAGQGNYLGPHDGRHMSTTALKVRATGRILPLVENPAIKMLRLKQEGFNRESILDQTISEEETKNWTEKTLEQRIDRERFEQRTKSLWEPLRKLKIIVKEPVIILRIAITLLKAFRKELFKNKKFRKSMWQEVYKKYLFLTNMDKYNDYCLERCKSCVKELASNGINEIVLYGTSHVAGILYDLARRSKIQIKAVYDNPGGKKYFEFDVLPMELIADYPGKVVVADLNEAEDKVERLRKLGVKDEKIVIV